MTLQKDQEKEIVNLVPKIIWEIGNEENPERIITCIKACKGVSTSKLHAGILWELLNLFEENNERAIKRVKNKLTRISIEDRKSILRTS